MKEFQTSSFSIEQFKFHLPKI